MIQLQTFVFNAFGVNTYVLYDETGACAIIDAAFDQLHERDQLLKFLSQHQLVPKRLLNTHLHIDHLLGNVFVHETFGLLPEYHQDAEPFLIHAREIASSYGFTVDKIVKASRYIQDGEIIRFGNSALTALHTPGHADGSVCFYSPENQFVITGDVLFQEGIGRTDLPTGDFDLLIKSIHEKLFSLPDEVTVYPGHGPTTKIGHEKRHNPFF
ncbi:MAG: MBL fold metallo-hydrolase [Bacteroidetes bacterium]|nr:MBL fold metallo-hydrolase [Bacteroidota bacterium]